MDDVKKIISETKVVKLNPVKSEKRDYKKPQLKSYGKLKEIKLGGSPGIGDSGNPTLQQT